MAPKIGEEPVPGYRLVRFLGRGGFGQVWQATSPGGILVALKLIDLSGREGLKEFKALKLMKSIRQANLTPILAFWLKDEEGFLVDEAQVGGDLASTAQSPAQPPSLQGTVLLGSLSQMRPSELIIAMGLGDKTLSDRLRECQQQGLRGIPAEELFNYMTDAARAIDFLNTPRHDLGHGPISPIQHCDIKPQNILIVGDTAQVCDFGLAREFGTNVKMTSAAVSPAYGAPELIEGRPPSAATDQYSLAITFVELRTGALPFADPDSYLNVVNAHLQSALDLSSLSADERAVILKATHRDPGQRFESAMRMVRALRHACPEDFGSVRAMPPPQRAVAPAGSSIDVTAPLPSSSGHYATDSAGSAATAAQTTETPSSRGFVTKLDPKNLVTTHDYATSESGFPAAQPARASHRVVKSLAAVLSVVGVIALIWALIPESPELRELNAANREIRKADAQADLADKAELLNSAIKRCEPFSGKTDFADLIHEAKDALHEIGLTVTKTVGERAKKIDALTSESERLKELEALVAYCTRFAGVLPGDDEVAKDLRNTVSWRDEVATALRREQEEQARKLVDEHEAILDAQSSSPKALTDAAREMASAAALVSNSPQAADVAFRAKLAAARARARSGQVPQRKESDQLWEDWRSLTGQGFKPKLRYKAQLCVLRALGAQKEDPSNPQEVINALADFTDPDLRQTLAREDWEDSQLEGVLDWIEKTVKPESRSSSLNSLLSELRPADAETVLKQAEIQWQAKNLGALASTLNKLPPSKASGVAGKNLRDLRIALTLADSASAPAEVEQALVSMENLLKSEEAVRLADLCASLAGLAQRDPSVLPRALELSVQARRLERDETQAKKIAPLVEQLYTQRIAQILNDPSVPDRQPYFDLLRSVCEQAARDGVAEPLVNLALAESALEGSGDKLLLPAAQIRSLLERGKASAGQELYEVYVRALARQKLGDNPAGGDADRAAEELASLAKGATSQPPAFALVVEPRRQQLAQMLVEGAGRLRLKSENGPLTLNTTLHPYGQPGEIKAEQAYGLLLASKQLAASVFHSPQALAELALATWHKKAEAKDSAGEDLRRRADQICEKLSGKQADLGADWWPVAFVHCQVHPEPAEAIRIRTALVDELIKTGIAADSQDVVELDKQLIEPALVPDNKLNAASDALKKSLARLYFQRCRIIRRSPEAPWPFADVTPTALASIEAADRLDPGRPTYLAERGYARLAAMDLDRAAIDAEQTIARDPNFYDGYALMAKVVLNKARGTGDTRQAAELLERSVQADTKAVELAKDDSSRFFCLLDLGTSYTELANYVDPRKRSRQELLNEAIQAVRKAQQIDQESYGDFAATRLGNAYEDLAWLAKVSVTENYNLAIEEFSKAIEKRPDLPSRWFDRGRCYFKREADSAQHGQGYADKAFDDLQHALSLDKKDSNAHIRFWLGKVYLYRAVNDAAKNAAEATANFVEAEKMFAAATELARKEHLPEMPAYAVAGAAARLKDKTYPTARIRAQLDVLLRAAETDAAGNKEYRDQLYLARGKSYERDGDTFEARARALTGDANLAMLRQRDASWSEAIKTYDNALGPDLAKNDNLDVGLLKARIHLRLAMPKNAAMYEDLVQEADRVVELMGDDADAEAYCLAARPRSPLAITLGSATPEAKARTRKLYKEAVDSLEKAIAASSESELNYTILRDHAWAIKMMVDNDRSLLAAWKPKAQRSIERALQIATPQAKTELIRVKREIDAL